MKKILKCRVCKSFTMAQTHCKAQTVSGHPLAYDPNDRYGDYRRKWKGVS